ncbi:MAG TPA: hypothetical protein ENN21_00005 [Spirochaetes bacterium]|nr:hypothetical protein [Spirochaetota bacterium]
MSRIDIHPVENSKSAYYNDFLNLPFHIYDGSECWVPWINKDMADFVDRRHPIFEHSNGAFLVARKNGRPVGRIFVFRNGRYNRTHKMEYAHYYFMDFYDDPEVSANLAQAALDWARKNGLKKLLGPMGFGGVTGGGTLIEGFDQRAAMTMMTYNHRYYGKHMEALGFEKYVDNYSFYLPTSAQLPGALREAADNVMNKNGFRVLDLKSKSDLKAVAGEVVYVFMRTLSDHVGNYVLTDNEISYLVRSLVQVADPKLFKIIAFKEKIIGFLFGFHDLSAALIKNRGKLNPLGIYRLLREYKKSDWLLVNGMGILPEYQGTGANAMLYAELEKTIRTHPKFKHLEMVQIAENTVKMLSNVKTLMGKTHKIHRIYQHTV